MEKDAYNKNGELVYPIKESVNKIGHGLHDANKKFEKFSYSNEIKYILKKLSYINPIIVQSMFIFKNGRIGGAVPPHTDNTYIRTDPSSCVVIIIDFNIFREFGLLLMMLQLTMVACGQFPEATKHQRITFSN